MSDDWAEAGKRHDTDDGGHWHEPSYPSCVVCRMRDFESQNQALQERIEEARKYVTEHGLAMMNTPATWHRFVTTTLEALSPTQETDPEEVMAGAGETAHRSNDGPTVGQPSPQETDPE